MVPPGWRIAGGRAIVVMTTKGARTMKTDLHCSTLHQVCPHCVPIRASPHYSSFKQPGRRRKEKSPLLHTLPPRTTTNTTLSSSHKVKDQESISSIYPRLRPALRRLSAQLPSDTHAHTHKYKIPDTSLGPFCCATPYGKWESADPRDDDGDCSGGRGPEGWWLLGPHLPSQRLPTS